MRALAPAVACGNGVVLKPHEEAAITGGTLLAKVFEGAGVAQGLVNIVVADVAEIGDAFLEHPIPRIISFTGSTAVGRHIAEVAGRHLKRVTLELGVNSALIVLEDADLALVVDAAVFSRFTHQGQICMCANRVIVVKDVYEQFLGKFVERVVETGMFHVNDGTVNDEPLVAFGGEKASGVGRYNGQWGIEEFTTLKWISIQRERRQYPI